MNFSKTTLTLIATFATLATQAQTLDHSGHHHVRPDSHAPIGVMGDHAHKAGEWMLSYRYMNMSMDGLRQGTDSISPSQAFAANYTVTPVSMDMEMHMFGAMKAVSDTYTLMFMIPYWEIEMEHAIFPMAAPLINLNDGSPSFTTRNSGWGDLKAGVIHTFWKDGERNLLLGAMVSAPTGSIDGTDLIPGPGGRIQRQMPAPMQLGSGSYEFRPSITYNSRYDSWSWGSQTSGIIRLDDNDNGYRRGNAINTQAWASKPMGKSLALNGRLAYNYTETIDGAQQGVGLNPPFAPSRRTVTTAFWENYGGETLTAAIGANYLFQGGPLKGNRLAAELSVPVYQDLNGIQLETDWTFTLGWQLAIK